MLQNDAKGELDREDREWRSLRKGFGRKITVEQSIEMSSEYSKARRIVRTIYNLRGDGWWEKNRRGRPRFYNTLTGS